MIQDFQTPATLDLRGRVFDDICLKRRGHTLGMIFSVPHSW